MGFAFGYKQLTVFPNSTTPTFTIEFKAAAGDYGFTGMNVSGNFCSVQVLASYVGTNQDGSNTNVGWIVFTASGFTGDASVLVSSLWVSPDGSSGEITHSIDPVV